MKRLLDSGIAIILLITISPLALLISVCILCIMGRPVLFRQKRPGLNGQPFILYKFRTLKEMRDKQGNYLPDADRITSMGKLLRRMSVDEIPQLVNVIKGEMSLVGPRPCLPDQNKLINLRTKHNIFSVRPGITGLSQINSIDMSSPEKLVKNDKKMIENFSLFNYFCYIFMTVLGKGSGDRVKL